MTKDQKRNTSDQEYQYPQDEYVAEENHDEQATQDEDIQEAQQVSRADKISGFVQRNKRILIVVLAAVVVLSAFHFASHHQQNKVEEMQSTKTKPQPVQYAQPDPQLLSELGDVRQQEQSNNSSINQLNNQIQSLQAHLEATKNANKQLNNSMIEVLEQMKTLSAKVSGLAQHKSKPKAHAATAKPVKPVTYQLKAIIPGRAWVLGSDGLSNSVAVGDTLAHYGRVQAIDEARGMVMTSSGKVIGFGVNDH